MYILTALALGVLTGLVFHQQAVVLKPLGDAFIKAVKMMVVPIVFVSIVNGIISIRDLSSFGRIATKALFVFIFTMASATTLALIVSQLLGIGSSLDLNLPVTAVSTKEAPPIVEVLLNMIPSNPIQSMAQGDVLPTIVFALLVGFGINLSGKGAEPVANFFTALAQVVFKMIDLVMKLAPLGIFALIAYTVGTQGISILGKLAGLVSTTWLVALIVIFGFYSLVLRYLGLSPKMFIRKMFTPQIVALTTTSSAATLPVNLHVAEQRLGVDKSIASFVLPVGSTVNMNGLSINLGVIAVFAANVFGLDLGLAEYISILMISTLSAIGAAGVPGMFLITMSSLLMSLGAPLELIALVAAVDRLIEMSGTVTNITGDTFTAVVVAKMENRLDETAYNS
ncbi:hypothetical protein GZ78_00235 [Endozoicomonas numazuensis]|uniref:Sodium:dicarboxylate symporter n=1 Tax=Endozoicomonas numazuensis TaxID=1137799 RepID=A0A081NJI5_9GAMM|nr:hypothetical protein GZ78_00235 [Endozoicomonas numazuensis]